MVRCWSLLLFSLCYPAAQGVNNSFTFSTADCSFEYVTSTMTVPGALLLHRSRSLPAAPGRCRSLPVAPGRSRLIPVDSCQSRVVLVASNHCPAWEVAGPAPVGMLHGFELQNRSGRSCSAMPRKIATTHVMESQ